MPDPFVLDCRPTPETCPSHLNIVGCGFAPRVRRGWPLLFVVHASRCLAVAGFSLSGPRLHPLVAYFNDAVLCPCIRPFPQASQISSRTFTRFTLPSCSSTAIAAMSICATRRSVASRSPATTEPCLMPAYKPCDHVSVAPYSCSWVPHVSFDVVLGIPLTIVPATRSTALTGISTRSTFLIA